MTRSCRDGGRLRVRAAARVVALTVSVGVGACGSPADHAAAPAPAPAVASAVPPSGMPAASAANLYADMKPVVSVKELMHDLIDPLSDNLFDAIGSVETAKGSMETAPKTEADWDKVKLGATAMVEGAYLLRIRRPFAPDGDNNNSGGPEPIELSPDEIQKKVDSDPVLWIAKIEALRNVGLQALDVAKRKQADELWDVTNNLDEACENCHVEYWYPNQKALLERLDRNLKEEFGKPGRSGTESGPARGR